MVQIRCMAPSGDLQNCSSRGNVSLQHTYVAFLCTVESWNIGHIVTRHFVLYGEVVLSLEVKMYYNSKGPQYVSFMCSLLCPLFGVSFIKGSIVYPNAHNFIESHLNIVHCIANL